MHQAGLSTELWRSVLDELARFVRADGALLTVRAQDSNRPLALIAQGAAGDEDFRRLIADHRRDVSGWPREDKGHDVEGTGLDPRQFLRVSSSDDDERRLARKNAHSHVLYAESVARTGTSARIYVVRLVRSGAFGESAVSRFESLLPAIASATKVNARLSQLNVLNSAALQALDSLRMAVFFVNREGRVRFSNPAAEELVRTHDGLRVEKGQLRGPREADSRHLLTLVRAACTPEQEPEAANSMTIIRSAGKRPLVVCVCGSAQGEGCHSGEGELAAIFAVNPDERYPASAVLLRVAYGLTAAEAEIAALVATGQGLVAAAEKQGISENTARTHLKRVFQKTGSTRQADLVRLLFNGLPQILPGYHPNG